MYLRSTALGKTLLNARVATIEASKVFPETLKQDENGNEPTRLMMTMEVVEPVHWTIRTFLEPSDVRRMLGLILKNPKNLFYSLCFLFSKGPEPKKIESTS
jgi:hypothetical protein